jgi:hypothetical protein
MATLLARKSGSQDNAIATDDEHHEALATDPSVSAFPQGSAFGGTNASTTTTAAFGSPTPAAAGGFGSSGATGGFGSPSSNGGFGAASPSPTASSNFGTNTSLSGAGSMGQPNQAELLKSGGGAMSEGGESTVALDKDAQDWINKKWRPVMGWVYMMTCTADFVVFPVLWSLLQALTHGNVTSQWQPLTLQGAGLYHIAMGAVLGIAAYGRTKEKIEGAAK